MLRNGQFDYPDKAGCGNGIKYGDHETALVEKNILVVARGLWGEKKVSSLVFPGELIICHIVGDSLFFDSADDTLSKKIIQKVKVTPRR